MSEAEIARRFQAASAAQQAGNADDARRELQAALSLSPSDPKLLNSLGLLELNAGDAERAAQLFGRAAESDPSAGPLWLNLAKAQRLLRDDEAERQSLQRALDIDQRNMMALIRMAELHERLGETVQAAQRWSGVLAMGRLVQPPPPGLAPILDHAAEYVSGQASRLAEGIDRGVAVRKEGLTARDRRRFEACVDRMFGRRTIYFNQCEGIHYPFLPADEFFDRDHFPWMDEIEGKTVAIRAEAEMLLREGAEVFQPYVAQEPGTPENKWTPLDRSLDWSAYHLWKDGQRNEEACRRCPATAAAVEALPLADAVGKAPAVFFSVLKPRSKIPPHTGVTNTRAIVHLPLIVPPGCGFRVGGETREWKVGEAFAFDDTIEHEAWNDSDEPRAVLIFDVWNPHLSEAERDLLRTVFQAIENSRQSGGA